MTSAYPAVVREGDSVIWDINGDRQALITVDKNTCVERGRRWRNCAAGECRSQLVCVLLHSKKHSHIVEAC